MRMQVTLNTDDDGYVSQECPACKERFKIKIGEGSDKPVSFCPYCEHNGQGCWWTPEQAKYIGALAGQEIIVPELDKMAEEINKSSGSGGFITMKASVEHDPISGPPSEANESMPVVQFNCCGETIKHDGQHPSLHCIICGEEKRL